MAEKKKKLSVSQAQRAFLSSPAPAGSTGRKVAQSKATPGSAQDAPASKAPRQRKPKAASFTPTMTGADLASAKPSAPSPKPRPKMRARGKLATAAVVGGAVAGAVGLHSGRKPDKPGEAKARADRLHRLHDTLYRKKK